MPIIKNDGRVRLPAVAVADVRTLGDIEADLVRLHLNIVGHPELWGAISVADAAIKECRRIALRDIDQDEVAALRAAAKRKRS